MATDILRPTRATASGIRARTAFLQHLPRHESSISAAMKPAYGSTVRPIGCAEAGALARRLLSVIVPRVTANASPTTRHA